MIRIERLSATNIKNLALKDTPFRRVTLVLGENGYGKTNLLRLIHCLLQPKTMPPELAKEGRFPIEGYSDEGDLLRRGETQAKVSLTVVNKNDKDDQHFQAVQDAFLGSKDAKSMTATFDFTLSELKPGILVEVTAIHVGEKTIYPLPQEKKGDAKKADQKKAEMQAAIEGWVRHCVAGKTTYIPTARLLKRNLVAYQVKRPATAVDNLENTILRLYTSKDEDPKALDRIKTMLKSFFTIDDIRPQLLPPEQVQVKSADGKPAPPQAPMASEIGVGIRVREGDDMWFDLDHVGSGIQQILAIVTMLEESKAKIALIEEFETSLSVKNRHNLLEQLIELTGNGKPLDQIITSSHAIFRAKQKDTILSIGPDKAGARDRVNFREWKGNDWEIHSTFG